MSTCATVISNLISSGGISGLPQIFNNTLTPVSLTPTAPCVLLLNSATTQTASFTLSGSSSGGPGSPVSMLVTVYKFSGGVATPTGSINIVSANTVFTVDFNYGTYLFCISSRNTSSFTGTLLGVFQGFPSIASLSGSLFEGTSMLCTMAPAIPPHQQCNLPIWFELVDGELPPGIVLQENGILEGIFPNLDCVDEAIYSPGVNWFYDTEYSTQPVGRQYRFQVKCWLPDFPQAVAYQWFCIRIYNDWSIDRDNFLKQPKTKTIIISDPIENKLPIICTPCESPLNTNENTTPNFQPLPVLCNDCGVESSDIDSTVETAAVEILNQRGPDDFDTLFLKWGNIASQNNPLFTEASYGDTMYLTLYVPE